MIDIDLIGTWDDGTPYPKDIDSDGWLFLIESSLPYIISPDGLELTFPTANSHLTYGRQFGDGQSLVGVWSRRELDGSDIWIEETYFRHDGTFTRHSLLNGKFHDELVGIYQDFGNSVTTKERRSQVSTSPPNQITFDQLYGPTETGTYSVGAGANQWTFNAATGAVSVYTRITSNAGGPRRVHE